MPYWVDVFSDSSRDGKAGGLCRWILREIRCLSRSAAYNAIMEEPLSEPSPDQTAEPHRMQCMQIWGSNRAIDSAVTMTGIDVRIVSRPFEGNEQGGDVYYLSSCASGRISRILLADVSGHGAQAADVARTLRELMQKHANHISQSRFCERINEEFTASAKLGYFATAVVLTYFAPRETLSVSSAGHPPPLHYHRETGRWSLLAAGDEPAESGRSLPLGITSHVEYSQSSVKLNMGDLVICYSDAFSEAHRANGEMLQSGGLLQLLIDAPVEQPDHVIPWLIDRLRRENAANLTNDDATVALITPNEETVPLRDNLLAPWRYARHLSRGLVKQ
ncbi:MAG: serine/threonine-protein phosphatase [Planctomycetota bacterium]|nr:MAG: serine/threonine-protein phosphatase [Planctomycetota bacterium]REJ94786.1 MAG: serine/threonine-protein phosphatase [Planctomycetota bacterium]REK21456.1 MAG: serine/threonine-protein phosphatase [Planctomycetota bacterium]REK40032.1 MAG: serine/threonine-protein phosphatase [Planctomycetota bacterium]